jgi:hypothetical protein
MYSDKITLFNRYKSRLGDMWYPTVIDGVNLLIDKAAIMAKFGTESKDKAVLNIQYNAAGGQIIIDGKQYLPPKEWKQQTEDKLAESITFASGTDFDFFMLGEYPISEPIPDTAFTEGFFNHMSEKCDFVFAVTSAAKYTAIPHFEITGE